MSIHGQPGFLRFYLLFVVDILLVIISGISANILRFGSYSTFEFNDEWFYKIVVIVAVMIISSYLFDVYNLGVHRDKRLVATNVFRAATASFITLSILYYLSPTLEIGRGLLAIILVAFIGLQYFWHVSFSLLFSSFLPIERVLVLGNGEVAEIIISLLQSERLHYTHEFMGFIETLKTEKRCVHDYLALCPLTEIEKQVKNNAVTHIVVAEQECHGNSQLYLELLNYKLRGVIIQDAQTFYEMQTGKLLIEHMNIDWLIFSQGFRRSTIVSAVKRQVDMLMALIGLFFLLPIFPLIALLVKLNSPGPVLYKQKRVGQWGKVFSLYKFRSMGHACEQKTGAVWSQQNDPRIRPIGAFLRKCRIDETPQLFNILRGEMSFIGPRPERPEFVKELENSIPLYGKRHFIKPGLTGWAQVCYPYGASVEDSFEKLRYDLYYFKNMSPIFDTIIFIKTIKVVLFHRGGR